MKAVIGIIPGRLNEVEFDSPTSVLDLCLKAKLINSALLRTRSQFLLTNKDAIKQEGLSSDFNQLVNDGDRIAICSGAQ
tara:strand:- start:8242 stop:8478 length:237 start_codon:yes stop_codon:yes gene_type:complete